MECGYIEAGIKAKRPRACPECGAPAPALEFFAYEGDGENEPDVTSPEDGVFADEDGELGWFQPGVPLM